jgi:pilus assembly protein FimV
MRGHVMKRGFLLFSAALFAGWMAGAQALGVGEIELNSHLNQRLSAEIPLLEAGELGPEEVLVSLGTTEDFERAGVERFFYLTDMRFEVFSDGRGPRIRITSRQPITEPYLNFIVEVLWPKGRMLKEFTILLDPPTYQAGVSPPASVDPAPATASTPSRQTVPEEEPSTADVAAPAVADGSSGAGTTSTSSDRSSPREVPGDGVLTTGQTLWRIAERYLPANDIRLNQYMLAIQQTNPEAFINNNINLMKAGYRLKMPNADSARAMTAAEAAAQVASQTAAWRNEEPAAVAETAPTPVEAEVATTDDPGPASVETDNSLAAQIDATSAAPSSVSDPDSVPAGAKGRLTLEADAESAGATESPAANVSDAGLQEEVDRLKREIQELGYQFDQEKAQAQMEIVERDRKLEVKDASLATLTAELEALKQQLAERGGQPSPDQRQPATPWWQSNIMMIGGGLLLVLVLVAALLLARRRQASAQDAAFREALGDTQARDSRVDPSVATAVAPAMTPVAALASASSTASATSDTDTFDFLDDLEQDNDEHQLAAPAESETGPLGSPARQTGDVIGEADIYAAYGRYPHAIGLLLGALEEDADRHDVRLKLLEVAVTANDGETFDKHIRELVNRCDDQDILLAARELEEGFVGVSEERDDLLGDETTDSPPHSENDDLAIDDLLADSSVEQEDDEFSLEIEDDEPAPSVASEPATSNPSTPAQEAYSLDDVADEPVTNRADHLAADDLDVQGDYTAIASDDIPSTRSDVLGGDLGIEFDADEMPASALPANEREPVGELGKDDPAGDLDLDDLLAELDDMPAAPRGSVESVTDRPTTPEDFQFKRVDDDVPLLDTSESLSDEMNLDGDQGLEDLDDLLASLDEVEEGSSPDSQSAPRSAEILSFTRPKLDGGVRSGRAFEDDLDNDAADGDEGFDFGDSEDAAETKLDLAQAYIEMGDAEGAQDILHEVLSEGNQAQKDLARSLLDSLAS